MRGEWRWRPTLSSAGFMPHAQPGSGPGPPDDAPPAEAFALTLPMESGSRDVEAHSAVRRSSDVCDFGLRGCQTRGLLSHTLRRTERHDQFPAERPQGLVNAVGGGVMSGIEHATHDFLVDAEASSKGNAGQTAVPEREGERGFCSHVGWNGYVLLARSSATGLRDGFVIVDAAGDRFLEGITCFQQGR